MAPRGRYAQHNPKQPALSSFSEMIAQLEKKLDIVLQKQEPNTKTHNNGNNNKQWLNNNRTTLLERTVAKVSVVRVCGGGGFNILPAESSS